MGLAPAGVARQQKFRQPAIPSPREGRVIDGPAERLAARALLRPALRNLLDSPAGRRAGLAGVAGPVGRPAGRGRRQRHPGPAARVARRPGPAGGGTARPGGRHGRIAADLKCSKTVLRARVSRLHDDPAGGR